MRGTKEFEDLMTMFERSWKTLPYIGCDPSKCRSPKLEDGTWPKTFYDHGHCNDLFEAYMSGYAYGKAVHRAG